MISRPSRRLEAVNKKIQQANLVRLFLDYDGTLADFAPNPGVIKPDIEVIDLIEKLIQSKKFLPAVISGRRLEDILQLLPVNGMLLAGTYGAEMQLPDGSRVASVDIAQLRPILEDLMLRWKAVISNRQGYYLEDKGCALALHARHAPPKDSEIILRSALSAVEQVQPGPQFALHTGNRFLEIAPAYTSKPRAVADIMERFTPAGALPVYVGDDEMDEEAFSEIKKRGGLALRVTAKLVHSRSDARLASYHEVRTWLNELVDLPEEIRS